MSQQTTSQQILRETLMYGEFRTRTNWQAQSACRREDPELFFPIAETGPSLAQIEKAKAVCRYCAVIEPCLQWALESRELHGIWGATTEVERRRLHRRARPADLRATRTDQIRRAEAVGSLSLSSPSGAPRRSR